MMSHEEIVRRALKAEMDYEIALANLEISTREFEENHPGLWAFIMSLNIRRPTVDEEVDEILRRVT
jgi:hypothetical protein